MVGSRGCKGLEMGEGVGGFGGVGWLGVRTGRGPVACENVHHLAVVDVWGAGV